MRRMLASDTTEALLHTTNLSDYYLLPSHDRRSRRYKGRDEPSSSRCTPTRLKSGGARWPPATPAAAFRRRHVAPAPVAAATGARSAQTAAHCCQTLSCLAAAARRAGAALSRPFSRPAMSWIAYEIAMSWMP